MVAVSGTWWRQESNKNVLTPTMVIYDVELSYHFPHYFLEAKYVPGTRKNGNIITQSEVTDLAESSVSRGLR